MSDAEGQLVAALGTVGHVLADDPVLESIQQLVTVVGQVAGLQRRGVATGQTERQCA